MRGLRWTGLSVGVLLLLAVAGVAAQNRQLLRCMLFSSSRLILAEPDVYTDPAMDAASRARLRSDIAEARQRVSEFLGGYSGQPVIVAGGLDVFRQYGGADGPDFSLIHTSPFRDYIVLGRSGTNVDCISHELMHAELRRRAGFLRYLRLPAWFDEGMAMYVDRRPEFGESEYQRRTNAGRDAPVLSGIASRRAFQRRDPYLSYLTAKHVFAQWYRSAGRQGTLQLLNRVRAGEEFPAVYSQLEKQLH